MNNRSSGLIDSFSLLASYHKANKNIWKYKAYMTAIRILRAYPTTITDINQLQGVNGLGSGILTKIDEYITSGRIQAAENVRNYVKKTTAKEKVLEELESVWGIGRSKANDLYTKGIRSLQDKKLKPLLTRQQLIGLKYIDEISQPIPRANIDTIKYGLMYVFYKEFKGKVKFELAGSYRRGKLSSGDIDCLITSSTVSLKSIVDVLIRWKIITDTLSMRKEKFMGIAHCPSCCMPHFRFDIEFLPEAEWASGLLYFTGSKELNVSMRLEAKRAGYKLNQHGLYKGTKRLNTATEEGIFALLRLEYIKPMFR